MSDRAIIPRHWDSGFLIRENDKVRIGEFGPSKSLIFTGINNSGEKKTIGIQFTQESFQRFHTISQKEHELKDIEPIINLFKNGTRRELISAFLEKMVVGKYNWIIKDFEEMVDSSRESIRSNRDVLKDLGILEVENSSANIPHYGLADTRVVKLLQSWDGYSPSKVFESRGESRQKLVRFFLFDANPNDWYSKSQIENESDVGYRAIKSHIDELDETDLLKTRPGKRAKNCINLIETQVFTLFYLSLMKLFGEYMKIVR